MQSCKRQKRTVANSTSITGIATILSHLFALPSPTDALTFLTSPSSRTGVTKTQRKKLAALAGASKSWQLCDQSIPNNVKDLSALIVDELYVPFTFYRESLSLSSSPPPRDRFVERHVTRAMNNGKGYWTAKHGTHRHEWLPEADRTFDATVHFVQSASGTGVHVVGDDDGGGSGGSVLTCAHVIMADDDCDDRPPPNRVGRQKVIMFPSGRTFIAECRAVAETRDGTVDVAVMAIVAEVHVDCPSRRMTTITCRDGGEDGAAMTTTEGPPTAVLSEASAARDDRLFCIGNPSSIDLESLTDTITKIDFHPPTWHASAGVCLGYNQAITATTNTARKDRGNPSSLIVGARDGGYLRHSCWTYWGHSGAPLFDAAGRVVGLHCAWDEKTGLRHGQKLGNLRAVMGDVMVGSGRREEEESRG